MIVDDSLRVRMVSGDADSVLGAAPQIGAPLSEAIGGGDQVPRIEQAVRRAAAGAGSELEFGIGGTVRCMPLSGDLAPGRALIVVAVSGLGPAATEIADLRARANDLELLMAAGRRLARSGGPDEVRESVCDAAADLAGADLAAVIELAPDRRSLVVSATNDEELEGQTGTLGNAEHATRAFSSGQLAFAGDPGEEPSWPLERVGAQAGAWQPVMRGGGVEAVIVVGWRRPAPPPSERVRASLELLAEEAGVALERAAALDHLTGLARTDPLTELSNSRAWRDELGRELARAERSGQRFAVGLIDLDDLKRYNDQWGHAAGDRVLLTAAARWRRRLRLTDLLARIGGDEFAVAMPGCSLAEAVELADQLRAALPDGVTCSIGVAEWSGSESAADLLARADQALYAAKNSGRDATYSLPTPAGPRAGSPLPSR